MKIARLDTLSILFGHFKGIFMYLWLCAGGNDSIETLCICYYFTPYIRTLGRFLYLTT